jgi:hypothetical protein
VVLIFILFGLIDLGRVFYFDVGLTGATREGARQASWFDPSNTTNPNPFLYDGAIKSSVDAILAHSSLPASTLGNASGTTCPAPADSNSAYNAPYPDSIYPSDVNQPLLFICYTNTPGLDLTSAPTDNSYKGRDVNVILLMSFGFSICASAPSIRGVNARSRSSSSRSWRRCCSCFFSEWSTSGGSSIST